MQNDRIEWLSGPERVRRRPAVVFLSDGLEGAQCAVRSLLKIFVEEARLGYCKQLKIKQSGEYLEISGNDRGIYLGQDRGTDEIWQKLFCQLDTPSAFPRGLYDDPMDDTDKAHHILYGDKPTDDDDSWNLEIYAIVCACRDMEVQVNRNGICSMLRFDRGLNIGGICNQPVAGENGTSFRFTLDPEVFKKTQIPESFFLKNLETFSILIPGLTCTYENAEGVETEFCCPKGAQTYIERKNSGSVYCAKMEEKGRERYNSVEYKAYVELAMGYTPNAGEIKCYHNFDVLAGGSHLEVLQKQLRDGLNICFGTNLTLEEIRKHLTLILTTRCKPPFTVWRNGTRQAIENRLITEMTQDILAGAFEDYLYEHKGVYQGLVDKVMAKRGTT